MNINVFLLSLNYINKRHIWATRGQKNAVKSWQTHSCDMFSPYSVRSKSSKTGPVVNQQSTALVLCTQKMQAIILCVRIMLCNEFWWWMNWISPWNGTMLKSARIPVNRPKMAQPQSQTKKGTACSSSSTFARLCSVNLFARVRLSTSSSTAPFRGVWGRTFGTSKLWWRDGNLAIITPT